MTERTVSATEARVHFGELLDSVRHTRDVVFVERAGVPQAVVVSADVWNLYRRGRDPWDEFAAAVAEYDSYLAEETRTGQAIDFDGTELIKVSRKERDDQLMGDLS